MYYVTRRVTNDDDDDDDTAECMPSASNGSLLGALPYIARETSSGGIWISLGKAEDEDDKDRGDDEGKDEADGDTVRFAAAVVQEDGVGGMRRDNVERTERSAWESMAAGARIYLPLRVWSGCLWRQGEVRSRKLGLRHPSWCIKEWQRRQKTCHIYPVSVQTTVKQKTCVLSSCGSSTPRSVDDRARATV